MKVRSTNNEYDIVVCGGGIAGISAALAAARQGKKVVLIEKSYMLGGLATAGLVTVYLPLCDGLGRQVSFGIAEQLLRLSIKYGAESEIPEKWLNNSHQIDQNDERFEVRYNAQVFAVLVEQLLLNENVDILYGSYVIDVEKENDFIKSVIVENKSGQTKYYLNTVVDATGDCDIAYFADAPVENFRQGNVLAAWYYFTDRNGYDIRFLGECDVPEEERGLKTVKPLVGRRFSGLDAKELSEMVCLSHKFVLDDWLNNREGSGESVISTMATLPQIPALTFS